MHYLVIDAKYVRDHVVWLRFQDGTEGEVDLGGELDGPVFEPLKDVAYFKNFSLEEYGTIVWPNGADFAPEFLHERANRRVPFITQ